jgi:hypothetical protein
MAGKWGDFFKILAQVGPLILMLNPATAAIAPVVIAAIASAQAMAGASGPEKKAHAMEIVSSFVTVAASKHVKGFEQPDVVIQTASSGIDTVVGAVKVIEGTKKPVDVTPGKAA